jgi:hypothetical protein
MWNKVNELSENGLNKSQISMELSIDRKTVSKMLNMSLDEYLSHISIERAYKLEPYESFIFNLLKHKPYLSSAIFLSISIYFCLRLPTGSLSHL